MRSIQTFGLLLGVLLCSLLLLSPLAIEPSPWQSEIWLYQAILDMHKGLHLIPSLNGLPIIGQNPINVILLSLSGMIDIFSLRLVSILLGCIVVSVVFIFSSSLWDLKSALASSVLTLTSLGFILTHSTLNTTFIPCSLSILAFAMFSLVYIKESNSWWYIPAYVFAGISTITGGWSFLAFFAFCIIFLILLDLSPKRFLKIRAISGIVIITLILASVYFTYRISAGQVFASSLFPDLDNTGIFARLWVLVKYSLPWLPLIIPAWIYAETTDEPQVWRTLLPAKIAFVMGAAILLFSPGYHGGHATIGIPFFCMLVGYWMAHGFILPKSLESIRNIFLLLTGGILIASAITIVSINPLKGFSITIPETIPVIFFIIAGLFLLWFVKKRFTTAIITLCICSVFVLAWSIASLQLPGRAEEPLAAVRNMTTYSPLLVYRDDLMMRGYIEHAGIRPIVVGRQIVPIGESAYLAATTDDLDDLMERLDSKMNTDLITSYKDGSTFALFRLSALEPVQ